MKINEIIIEPILTEKSTNLAKKSIYMFNVSNKANKYQIKNVLEKIYQVKIKEVNLMVRKGKNKRVGRKMIKRKLSDKKIAFVKLKEGKIDLFSQV